MSLLYVIDGYNLTNSPAFSLHKKNKTSVQAVIDLIRIKRLVSPKNKAILVFDGYPPTNEKLAENDGNIEIVYSRDDSADNKIKKMVEKSGSPKNIVVISDDREIRFFIRSLGAHPVGTNEFIGPKFSKDGNKRSLKEECKTEIGYAQMHRINEELKNIWLK